MTFIDPEYYDPWRPSSISEYELNRLDVSTIEEFMADPLELIKVWFEDFTLVKHEIIKPRLDPTNSITKGYVPRGEVVLPVEFQAVMPSRLSIVFKSMFKKDAEGKLHSWTYRVVRI